MENDQLQSDGDDTEHGGCTPAKCRRKHNDQYTASDGENMELAGIATDNSQRMTEGGGSTREDVEDEDADEESVDESLCGDITDDEEGDGIEDMSQLGSGATKVQFQTVQQQSYQLVNKDTTTLAPHNVGTEQHQGTQLQPAPAVDVHHMASQAQLSTTTACVVPETSLQVPRTSTLTLASTSSLLPRIPETVVSEIQSSGIPEVPVTGGSPVVIQYIKQEFPNLTVKGARNLNIGGTQNIGGSQNVGTPQTDQKDGGKPLTTVQIRKRTESRIQFYTKDMVETEALHKVTDKLDRGATWVTIKGRPGEGKTTIAYIALKDQHSQGRQVYKVESPEEFNEVITTCTDPVIMLDDIFGDLEFDAASWAKWRQCLQPIVDMAHPGKYTENNYIEKSTKIDKVSERTKDVQTQRKKAAPNKRKTIIILVGRDYVLKSSLADLGKMTDCISSPKYVVEVSSQRDSNEKRKIWDFHACKKDINFEESTVSQICQADCPHGFPHVCKMFVTAYEKDQTLCPVETFFQTPLAFLKQTLNKFLKDETKRLVFMAMIKRDGKISGQELEEDDNLGYACISAAEDLVGSYLKKECSTYMFDHPSIYDSIALILSTNFPMFVIENCSLSFIHQRLRLNPPKGGKNVPGETDLVTNIPWTYARHLARRLATEMTRCNLLHVLSHQACCNSMFIDLLIDCLKKDCHVRVPDILKLTDKTSGQTFCELLSSNKSYHLIKVIVEKLNISFKQGEISDIVLGLCKNAAFSILINIISKHMDFDKDDRCGSNGETPLMLAAETKNSLFVNQILSLGPDLNVQNKTGDTALHTAARIGSAECVGVLLKAKADLNVLNNTGNTPLHEAARWGSPECVGVLLKAGTDVNVLNNTGDTPLHEAARGGSPECVGVLLKARPDVNIQNERGDTPLHEAAPMWESLWFVDELLKAGADVNVQNFTGDTPLHRAATQEESTEFLDVLLKAGADANVQNNTGDTPLHEAVRWDSAECLVVLLEAGADVNVKNKTGDTPLHNATAMLSSLAVDALLQAGADINVENNTGDTPLHNATTVLGPKSVDVLLKARADVNVQNNTGDTPLHKAAAAVLGPESEDVLLKAGADFNDQDDIGISPLLFEIEKSMSFRSTVYVDALLKAGADVNVQNNSGDTPLHKGAAEEVRSTKSVDALLKAGADIDVKNNSGDTPLHAAVERGSTDCVDALLKARADVNVQNN